MKIYSRELRKDPTNTKRLRLGYEKTLVGLIKRLSPNWPKLVQSVDSLFAAKKGNDLQYLVARVIEAGFYSPASQIAATHTLQTYLSGQAKATANLKGIGIGGKVGPLPPDPKVLGILNARNIAALKGISDDMANRIKNELTTGILAGEGMEKLAGRLEESVKMPIARARAIARTETMYAFNQAQLVEYRRYGIDKVEWLTAEDERTCPKCAPLDGKEYSIDKHPECPAHPNCRCTLLAVPEEI